MDNVIRPSFGGRQQLAGAEPPAYEDGYQPLYVYGQAAGHLIALRRIALWTARRAATALGEG